jgi:hypothetical protein
MTAGIDVPAREREPRENVGARDLKNTVRQRGRGASYREVQRPASCSMDGLRAGTKVDIIYIIGGAHIASIRRN